MIVSTAQFQTVEGTGVNISASRFFHTAGAAEDTLAEGGVLLTVQKGVGIFLSVFGSVKTGMKAVYTNQYHQ
jgi:hypothetical protein